MSKNIDPSQQEIRDTVKEFAEKEIHPVSDQLDRMAEPRKFPIDLYKKMGAAGFIGCNIPKDLGGQGKSRLQYVTLIEELSYHDAAVGLLCAVGEMAASPMVLFGSDQQKKKYVPDCASGKTIPAFVLTEPGAGADVSSLNTVAVEDGDHFVVNVEKMFIMHGDVAEVGVLFCR
ncbi:MAG: acyl-CoA dehydrogenase family protein, partial [Candidatus Zixiibacteriota bacterium]